MPFVISLLSELSKSLTSLELTFDDIWQDLSKDQKWKEIDSVMTQYYSHFTLSNVIFRYSSENIKFPLAGLFAKSHISYEIDRDDRKEPSLKQMTKKALEMLNKGTHSKHSGFFLMIEGSKLDLARTSFGLCSCLQLKDAPPMLRNLLEPRS